MDAQTGSRQGAVVGVAESGSAAVLVTLGPDGALLDRRRVDLVDQGLPTHPHHHEGSWAVGRYLGTPGARPMPLEEAVALVEQVRASAGSRARAVLAALAASVREPIARIAIRAYPALPPTIEGRIRDNRAQTFADSAMYREALAEAATELGWSVYWYDGDDASVVAACVPGGDLASWLRETGRRAGPPWHAAHKRAATAALAAGRHPVRG